MPTKFSLAVFLCALIGASILAPHEAVQCETDTECEALNCFILCE